MQSLKHGSVLLKILKQAFKSVQSDFNSKVTSELNLNIDLTMKT